MRYVLFGLLTLFATIAPAQAQWCAYYRGGGNNCGFRTFEQCQASISGVGGICNSTSAQPERKEPQRVERPEPRAGSARPKSARQEKQERLEKQERQERQAKQRQEKQERARQEKQEKAKQASRRRELPKEKPAAFSPGDDEHIIPAEPDDEPVTQATATQTMESETMVAPAGQPGARTGDFIAARDLVLRGNYQAGLSALQSLNQDTDPDVAAYIGYAYAKLGRSADARTWYEKALALDPNHLWALSYYGLLLVDEGKLQPARANLDKIKSICGGTGCFPYASLQAAISTKR